jgi:hypothetical protein
LPDIASDRCVVGVVDCVPGEIGVKAGVVESVVAVDGRMLGKFGTVELDDEETEEEG